MDTVAAQRQAAAAIAATIMLPRSVPPVFAAGGFLKNTQCFAAGARAHLSVDAGNLETVEAVTRFEEIAEALLVAAEVAPSAIAHDRHPDFYSTRYAEALAARLAIEAVPVQHHHAHVAAVMAEHGLEGPVLGLALDGFGLGDDGEAWGGELLEVDPGGYRRLGHLRPLRQPGGDKAAREPWRMGAAALYALGRADAITERYRDIAGAELIGQMLNKGINAPATTSCGRLFDAACGLLGIRLVASFEGEAPMALEALVERPRLAPEGWRLDGGILDLRPLLAQLLGLDPKAGAELFHGTLVAALAEWAARAAETAGVRDVVLSGGCFLNGVLSEGLITALEERRLRPLSPVRLGPGDAAISLGQAWSVVIAKGGG